MILETSYTDGEVLYSGLTTSTSSLNGITYTVNQKEAFGDSDTAGSIGTSTAETTIASVTIPANTFTTRAIMYASIGFTGNNAGEWGTLKLKLGTAASETLKQTIKLVQTGAASAGEYVGGSLLFVDEAEDYTTELSCIVTGQNKSSNAARISQCFQLSVSGI